MASDKQRILRAARRYGRTLDPIAQRYTDPVTGKRLSGEALILKTVKGESGGRRDAVSSAGAKGIGQFMPGTRAAVIKQFGVDPWRSPEEAVHALTLHMRGKLGNATGLEGYNPGGGSGYVNYILGQRIGSQRAAGGGGGGGGASPRSGAGGAPASSGAVATPQADPNAAFNPGALAQAMAAPQLEKPQLAPSSGVAMPGILTPDFYQPIPTSGPPAPPPELDLTPQVSGQNVTFGGPAGKAPDASLPKSVASTLKGGEDTAAGGGGGADAALSWVHSKLGAAGSRESGGENHGPLADFLNQRFGFSGAPWCAMFTSAAVTKGGAPKEARTASVAQVRAKAQAGQGYHRGFVSPGRAKPGDLVLFGNSHIAMVTGVKNGRITYIGGNQSDSVSQGSTTGGGNVSIVRPKYGAR